jgi:hypothetical protein
MNQAETYVHVLMGEGFGKQYSAAPEFREVTTEVFSPENPVF